MASKYIVPYLTLFETTCHCGQHRKEIEQFMQTHNIGKPCWSTYGSKLTDWDERLLELWVKYRKRINKPITVNSGGRCEAYNNYIYMKDNQTPTRSQHLNCMALDLMRIDGMTIDQMAKIAEEVGFVGIGKYSWGIHVDTRPNKARWDYR